MRARVPASLVLSFLAFVMFAVVSRLEPAGANNYVLMAQAWLHGNAYLATPVEPYIGAIPWRGHYELVEAPMPGVLLLPLVMLWGIDANQTLLAIVLAAIGIGAAWLLCERLEPRCPSGSHSDSTCSTTSISKTSIITARR